MSWKNDQVSAEETAKILSLARSTLAGGGDFVEFGCYAGDTSLLLAALIRDASPSAHRPTLYLYDSFEGLPEKSMEDASALGRDFIAGALSVTKREVKERFLRANLPLPVIKKAWFNNLTAGDLPHRISFAFLDGDLYDSIKTSLALVAPRLQPGAIIVIHDYTNPALPGVMKAADEWLSSHPVATRSTFQSMLILHF